MKIIQEANCNNSPKNQKVADMTQAILTADKEYVNSYFEAGLNTLDLPKLANIAEITILTAISHGKSASSLSVYTKNNVKHYIGMFFVFTTHKAEAYKEIIVTEGEVFA